MHDYNLTLSTVCSNVSFSGLVHFKSVTSFVDFKASKLVEESYQKFKVINILER